MALGILFMAILNAATPLAVEYGMFPRPKECTYHHDFMF